MAGIAGPTEQNTHISSPAGSHSPVISCQDSTVTVKTTMFPSETPVTVRRLPFYLMREPPKSELTGATNFIRYSNLQHAFSYYKNSNIKEQLSTFLPNIPGNVDSPGDKDNSSLKSVVEKPPIVGKELLPLTSVQLSGFRVHPGPLPEQFDLFRHKPKQQNVVGQQSSGVVASEEAQQDVRGEGHHEQVSKKRKRDENKKEKKKKKKDKKEKKKKKDKKEKKVR